MAYATLSNENKIIQKVKELDETTAGYSLFNLADLALLAGISGASAGTLSRTFAASKPLTAEVGSRLVRLLDELRTLRDLCAPLVVSFKDANGTAKLIEARRDGELEIRIKINGEYTSARMSDFSQQDYDALNQPDF
jgi:hypothetical protein